MCGPKSTSAEGVKEVRMSRRGNPNFGKPVFFQPAVPTEFEQVAIDLHLSETEYVSSASLRDWAKKNRNNKYVPASLLAAWGLRVDED
jgi:hypothetical protein